MSNNQNETASESANADDKEGGAKQETGNLHLRLQEAQKAYDRGNFLQVRELLGKFPEDFSSRDGEAANALLAKLRSDPSVILLFTACLVVIVGLCLLYLPR